MDSSQVPPGCNNTLSARIRSAVHGSGSAARITHSRAITRVVGCSNAKAAIDNFTRWLAVEFATKYGDGLRVNAIAPGFVVADQNRLLLLNEDGTPTVRGQAVLNQTPFRCFGCARELHGALHFLVSDASAFITGVVMPIDGGFSPVSEEGRPCSLCET